MTTKKKAARAGTRTASRDALDSRNPTRIDSLIGWCNLVKPSRNRQQERGWQSGTAMKAQFKKMIVRLAVCGLTPASFATWLIQRGGLKDA